MNALLRRDLPLAGLLTLLGTVALTIALTQDRFRDVWVFEPSELEATFYTAWAAGLALGIVVALRDRVLGVRDQVRHRPLSATRLQAGRLTMIGLVLVAWWVLAPLGSWLCEATFGHLVGSGQPSRYGYVLATMMPAASAAALALLAANLPVAWWAQAFVAAALLFVGFPACDALATTDGIAGVSAFAAAHLAFAAGLAALSFAFADAEHDADRSWTRRAPWWAASLVLATAVAGGTLGLAPIANNLARALAREYPSIGRVGDRLELLRWGALTGTGSRGSEVVQLSAWRLPMLFPSQDPEIEPPQFGERAWQLLRIDRRGFAQCLLYDVRWSPRYFSFGRGDAMTPFRDGARIVAIDADGRAESSVPTMQSGIWVAEPGATEICHFDPRTQTTRLVPLPGSDRIAAFEQQERDDPPAAPGLREPTWILRGDRGSYVFGHDDLALADPAATAAIAARASAQLARHDRDATPQLEIVGADVLAPHLRMVAPDGKVLFEHVFAPQTATEKLLYACAVLPSLLRSPLLQVGVHTLGPDAEVASLPLLLDPVVAGGRRSWLVLAGCLCSGILACLARRRLLRAGADARTRRLWTIGVALTGPLGALCCHWFEPSRAWHLPAATSPTPPRIRTEDAA